MSMGRDEKFKEYAQKWRDLAGRVQPPLSNRELVDMLMGTLTDPFFNHLIGNSSTGFTENVLKLKSRVERFKSRHLQMLRRDLLVVRKKPMLCMVKKVVSKLIVLNLWGHLSSPILHQRNLSETMRVTRTRHEDNLRRSTCHCRKHCNTC